MSTPDKDIDSKDDDELSDFDDDILDNEDTTNWLDDEDDEEEIDYSKVQPVIHKIVPTNTFLISHIDTFYALSEMEDLNFNHLPLHEQSTLIDSIKVSTYKPGDFIFKEDDIDSTQLFIVIATEDTAKYAEVEILKKIDEEQKLITRLRRGHVFGHKYFLFKELVRSFGVDFYVVVVNRNFFSLSYSKTSM
jgi:hypothetical protein